MITWMFRLHEGYTIPAIISGTTEVGKYMTLVVTYSGLEPSEKSHWICLETYVLAWWVKAEVEFLHTYQGVVSQNTLLLHLARELFLRKMATETQRERWAKRMTNRPVQTGLAPPFEMESE